MMDWWEDARQRAAAAQQREDLTMMHRDLMERLVRVADQQELLRLRLEALFTDIQRSIDQANRALATWCAQPHPTKEDDHDLE